MDWKPLFPAFWTSVPTLWEPLAAWRGHVWVLCCWLLMNLSLMESITCESAMFMCCTNFQLILDTIALWLLSCNKPQLNPVTNRIMKENNALLRHCILDVYCPAAIDLPSVLIPVCDLLPSILVPVCEWNFLPHHRHSALTLALI